MRISDWSSDVCSSDLDDGGGDDGRARYRTTSPFMRARLAVGLGAGQLAFAPVVGGGAHARALAQLEGIVVARELLGDAAVLGHLDPVGLAALAEHRVLAGGRNGSTPDPLAHDARVAAAGSLAQRCSVVL